MKIRFAVFVIAFAMAPFSANAATSYLTCTVTSQPGWSIEVAANEETSTVTTNIPMTGFSGKGVGIFTASDVVFGDRDISYRISRTDLSFERTIRILRQTDRGFCKVNAAPRRAF